MLNFLKEPIVIFFLIIIGIVILLIIGKKYWGWFPSLKDQRTSYEPGQASKGFPVNNLPGDTFVLEGVKYTWTPITYNKSKTSLIQYAWLTDEQDKKGCSIFLR